MNKPMMIAVAILVTASTTGAFAKEISGTVSSVDKPGDSITLSDGTMLALPENIEVEKIKPGEKVRVVYFTNKAGKDEVKTLHRLK